MTCRCYEKVGMVYPCWLNVVDGPFSWRDTARLVKYRHVWERMGSGGPRGPQNRCEACNVLDVFDSHTFPPTHPANRHKGACPLCGGMDHVDETASKHAICTSGAQKRFYLHRNQNETSARRLMRNFAATVRYYPYSIKLAAYEAPRTTPFFSINWRKHELHAESSRRAQGPLSRAA